MPSASPQTQPVDAANARPAHDARHHQRPHRIRFSECDPAGIVFYPQYFVLFNDLMESWVDTLLPGGFAQLVGAGRCGLPTVRLEADFKAISRMGDEVVLSLHASRIGHCSMTLDLACTGADGVLRMAARQTVVTTSLETHRATPIPAPLRAALGQ